MSQPKDETSCKRHTKNYLIRPSFQWKYSIVAVSIVFLVALIVSAQAYGVLFQQARSKALYNSSVSAMDIIGTLVLSATALAAIPALALGLWSVIATHRICGPLYVLERHFGELSEGRFPKRRALRKKDEFKDFYDLFWKALKTLEEGRRADLEATVEIRNLAGSATGSDDETRKNALETILARSEAQCEQIAMVLGIDLDEVDSHISEKGGVGSSRTTEFAGVRD